MPLHLTKEIHFDESAINVTLRNQAWHQFRNDQHLDAGDFGELNILIDNGPSRIMVEWDADFDVLYESDFDGPTTHKPNTFSTFIKKARYVLRVLWDTDEGVTVNFGRTTEREGINGNHDHRTHGQ